MTSEEQTKQIKHLEFIQNIINRLNTNSFQIKGMSITLTAGLLAISGTLENKYLMMVAYFVIITFWYLDSIYLSLERGYRELFDEVRNQISATNYDLTLQTRHKKDKDTWDKVILSKTLAPLYILQAILSLIIMIIFIFK